MPSFDFVIRNASVVDGTGAPRFTADVAISGDRIAAIGSLPPTPDAQEIDATGLILTPGFVDSHVHTDLLLLSDPDFPAGVYQGVTTHIIGQDGISYAPSSPAQQAETRHYFAGVNGDPALCQRWSSVAEYLACFDGATAQNVAYLLPQGTIRLEVMGYETRHPTPEEMAQMQALARQGMLDGAIGISTGMDYIPCYYSNTEELCEITKPVGELGGIYVSHIRSYSKHIVEAIDEVVTIGREAKCPVHISHYNGPAPKLSALVDNAAAAGADISFDTYPYLAGCTILTMVALPRWMEEGGVEKTLARLADPAIRQKLKDEWFTQPSYPMKSLQLAYIEAAEDRDLEGLSVPEAAEKRGECVPDFICNLLIRSRLRVGCIAFHSNRTWEDVCALMKHSGHVAGSDGIYKGSRPHPRGFGTFATYLEIARDQNVMPLEEMIVHLTSRPARRFHLKNRGVIAEGKVADLALFNLAEVKATATYEKPALAEGMKWVFVNGKPVLANGKATGLRPGVAVRGPAHSA